MYKIQRPNPKKNMVYGTLCRSCLYNLTLCPLQIRHIYQGQPYARVDLNLVCQSRPYVPSQGLRIWPLEELLCTCRWRQLVRQRPGRSESHLLIPSSQGNSDQKVVFLTTVLYCYSMFFLTTESNIFTQFLFCKRILKRNKS